MRAGALDEKRAAQGIAQNTAAILMLTGARFFRGAGILCASFCVCARQACETGLWQRGICGVQIVSPSSMRA